MRKFLMALLGIVLFIAAVILVMRLAAKPAPGRSWFQNDRPRPLVMAHQGGDGLWPGNTRSPSSAPLPWALTCWRWTCTSRGTATWC